MAVGEKPSKVPVDLGDRALLRALQHAAIDHDMTVREVVIEAVRYWLDHQEEIEDELAAQKADRVEAESDGQYVPWDQVRRGEHVQS
jgi:hypothetical protein